MQKFKLQEHVEFGDKPFLPNVLVKEPGNRVVLVNIRGGHKVPEHTTPETVTIYAVSGHITFFQHSTGIDLTAGEVLWCDGRVPHHIEAHEDSSLLVVAAGAVAAEEEVIDVRTIVPFQRHPLIFAKFDQLAVGESFLLVNDHDPMPLHRQLDTMRPEQVSWEYLRRGPEIYQIRIRRIAPSQGDEVSPVAHQPTVAGIQSAR